MPSLPKCETPGCTSSAQPDANLCGPCAAEANALTAPDTTDEVAGADMLDGTAGGAGGNVAGVVGFSDGTTRGDSMTVEEIERAYIISRAKALGLDVTEASTRSNEEVLDALVDAGQALEQAADAQTDEEDATTDANDADVAAQIEDAQDAVEEAIDAQENDTEHDEQRSYEDYCVAQDIQDAYLAVQTAIATQATDLDTDSGEFDAQVNAALQTATEALLTAIKAQAQDIDSDSPSWELLSADEETETRGKKQRRRSTPDIPMEERVYTHVNAEFRVAESSDDSIVLEGMPIVYNQPYPVRDMFGVFTETMERSVMDHVLASPTNLDCRFLFNHDGMPLARTTNGTLELENTDKGLKIRANLDPRQSLARDLSIAIERGDVTQMSCGFTIAKDGDTWSEDGTKRSINSIGQLLDVSPVTYPASPTTSIGIATRSVQVLPVESRARLREAFAIVNEIRAGRKLSQQNADLLNSVLESLHAADDQDPQGVADRAASIAASHAQALDALQQVEGLEQNEGGDDGQTEAVTDPGESVRSEEDIAKEVRYAALLKRTQSLKSLDRRRFS